MADKITGARLCIRGLLERAPRVLIGFSGGVDSIVTAVLAREEGVTDAYGNMSFHFPSQEEEIREIAADIGIDLAVGRPNENAEWIEANAEHLFPPPKQFITGNYSLGNAFSVMGSHDYAIANGYGGALAGTTTDQNGITYQMVEFESGLLTAYPIIRFKREEVWGFLRERGIATPRSYSVPLVKEWLKNTGGDKRKALRSCSWVETYFNGGVAEMCALLEETARYWGDVGADGRFTAGWWLEEYPFLRERG